MKAIRLALLLGVASTLIGCNNNNGPHTITFTGNNCVMSYEMGGDPITAPITVDHGGEANFVIYTQDSETYAVPEKLDVQGQAEVTYSPAGQISSQASLVLKNITSDITITANGREKVNICSVTYYSDEVCQWDRDNNPGSVMKGETLVAHLNVTQGYTFTNENIFIIVEGTRQRLATDKYTFTNNSVLTVDGEYITNNITIYAGYVLPDVEQYDVNFTMEHAESHFPEKEWQYIPLEGYFIAEEGYRVPTKDELAPEDVGQQPYESKIIKTKPGTIYHLRPNQFYYETYVNSDGRSAAYLYIFDIYELSDAESIEIGGAAIQQVKVTFQVGEEESSHWPEGGTADKIGTIDIEGTLDDAARACGANMTPVVDNPARRFDAWYDSTETIVNPSTSLTKDLTVHAKFKDKTYSIVTSAIKHATATLSKTEDVLWHEEITGTIAAETNYKLPNRSDIEVWHGLPYQGDNITQQITYTLNDASTEAEFKIPSNIIENNVYIIIDAYQVINVTFSPGEGKWRDGGTTPKTVEIKEGMTYQEALNKAKTGGDPLKDGGYVFDGWYKNGVKIIDMNAKVPSPGPITLTAQYEAGAANFATDSWTNIVKYSDQGLDALWEHYGTTMYLGAQRTLYYKEPFTNTPATAYSVRLIDYNSHDTIAGTSKKATLTFEFVNLIGEGKYGVKEGQSYSNWDNNWSKSLYRKFLSDFYKVLTGNDPDTSQPLNPGFAAKKVVKSTMCVDDPEEGDPSWYLVNTEDNLFPLSGSEIGISGINHRVNPVSYNEDEGRIYDYYWYYKQQYNPYMAKKFLGSTTEKATDKYWLRSPHTVSEAVDHEGEPDTSGSYYIQWLDQEQTWDVEAYHGIDFDRCTTDYVLGYMAAFCI